MTHLRGFTESGLVTTQRASIFLVILGLALASCAPASPQGSGPAAEGRPAASPKVLTLAIQREPEGLHEDLVLGRARAGGVARLYPIVHSNLAAEDDRRVWIPRLAAEQISVEAGTWRVNADGTMDTIWKLRPDARWHDGAAFTASDLLFAFTVYKDPAVPNRIGAVLQSMQSAEAPDPYTFVVHWSRVYVRANEAQGLIPLPRHLLEQVYASDKENFGASPVLSREFVGLGPYRLVQWEQGSHLDLARFDGYFLGRPPLDRVIVKFIGDPSTIVANILAGVLDVVVADIVDVDVAVDLQNRWEGTGNQVFMALSGAVHYVQPQHRPEYAKPLNALTNPKVRQALYQAIDRPALAEILTHGLAPIADSWFAPGDTVRQQVEGSVPQFPYDVGRATAALEEAGWVRGADSILVHRPSGERFELEVWASQGISNEKQQLVVAENWKAVGVQPSLYVIPSALTGDRAHMLSRPGAGFAQRDALTLETDEVHSRFAASEANRWTGLNRSGYANLRADALLDRLSATINPRDRLPLQRELVREVIDDLAIMPLYWGVSPVIALKGVKGIHGRDTWNFYQWDKE